MNPAAGRAASLSINILFFAYLASQPPLTIAPLCTQTHLRCLVKLHPAAGQLCLQLTGALLGNIQRLLQLLALMR